MCAPSEIVTCVLLCRREMDQTKHVGPLSFLAHMRAPFWSWQPLYQGHTADWTIRFVWDGGLEIDSPFEKERVGSFFVFAFLLLLPL